MLAFFLGVHLSIFSMKVYFFVNILFLQTGIMLYTKFWSDFTIFSLEVLKHNPAQMLGRFYVLVSATVNFYLCFSSYYNLLEVKC